MANNPIKYSDLVQPDNSISTLIEQLIKANAVFDAFADDIIEKAKKAKEAYEKLNTATKEGQEETKKAANEADALQKEYDKLSAAQSENNKKIQELRLEQQRVNAETKNTIKLNNAAEGSFNQLSAQYALNKQRLNAMSKEMRENTKEGQELEKQTKDILEEMRRLQTASGGDTLKVGDYTNSIKEALGLNSKFGESLMGITESGEGMKGMFSTIGTNVVAFGKTLLTLLTNPVFLVIAGIAGVAAAAKFWFDYNKGLMEATNLTKQFTGKSGNDLVNYRSQVQTLADMYDKDFKEVLLSVNAVSKQFGISQDEALKIVKDGFIAGADANGEYLDTLKEYSTQFKAAGLSAKDFVAITTQGTQTGVFSDKAVDTVKEGMLRIREMPKATQDALKGIGMNVAQVQKDLASGAKTPFQIMQEVSKKLSELPANSSAVGTAIADIFGGPGEDAGLEYIKTLKDIQLDLDKVKGKTGELGKLQEEQYQSQVELSNAVAAVFDATGGTFESLLANGRILINEVLIGIIQGLIGVANGFIEMYNQSMAFRIIVESIKTAFKNVYTVVSEVFTFTVEQLKAVGGMIKSVFTLDWEGFKAAYKKGLDNTLNLAKNTAKGITNNLKEGYENVTKNAKIKPIEIPTTIVPAKEGQTKTTKKVEPPKPPTKKATDKDIEEAYKKNLALVRAYEDAETELIQNEFDKREQQTKLAYERKKQDLQHQLKTEKGLNKQGKDAINGMLKDLDLQYALDKQKIEQDRQTSELNNQKATLDLRLAAVEKGSKEELALKKQQIENERKLALLENSKKAKTEQQDPTLINAKFDYQSNLLADEANKIALQQFDQQQALATSEMELLKRTENEKTKFKLAQERDRLKKLLELNQTEGTKMSDVEVATMQNTIKKLDAQIAATDKSKFDFYAMIGLKLDNEQKAIMGQSVQYAIDGVNSILSAKVEAAQAAVDSTQKEVDSTKSALDKEIEARNNGYASNVALAQKEYEQAKKNNEKALKDKEKAQKAQKLLDTATQASSLITASANIWASFSGLGPLGAILAIGAIATMWGSFAAAKIKAKESTKYGEGGFEFLEGGSHASGNDINIGMTSKGRQRKAEGGETLAIFSKKSTSKYRSAIPSIVNSINKGTFEDVFGNAYQKSNPLTLNNYQVKEQKNDLKTLETTVKDIKTQNERRYYTNAKGQTVEIYKNLKRTYVN